MSREKNEQQKTPSTLLSHKGYSLDKFQLTSTELRKVKKTLSVAPISHPDYPKPQPFDVFEEGKRWIRIPRNYGKENHGIPEKIVHQDHLLDDEKCLFVGDLREKQMKPFQTCIKTLDERQTGILSLQTGQGKTVILLRIIAELKQRTCVLVHTSMLLEQWRLQIRKFLPNMQIGIIQQKNKTFLSLIHI